MEDIKYILIKTGQFVDNEWLDKYVELIKRNENLRKQKTVTQKHHIIPRYCEQFIDVTKCSIIGNTVNLLLADHATAHYYLALCSLTPYSRYANESSIKFICRDNKDVSQLMESLDYYSDLYADYIQLNSAMQTGKGKGESNPFYGKHHSQETISKMKKNHPHLKGENHPNYGNHMSEESKRKISDANRGRIKTQQEIQKRIETIESMGGMSQFITEETREKISMSRTEWWNTNDNKKKASEKTKSLWEDNEYRKKHIDAMRGKKKHITYKECAICGKQISASNYKRHIECHKVKGGK